MSQASLFSLEESEAVKTSWKTVTQDGVGAVGLIILHRFLNDVPEVRKLFYKIGIDDNDPDTYSMETLKRDKTFSGHAKRVALAIDNVVRILDNTEAIVEKCTNLGKDHVKHNVQPEYFDRLGEVIVTVISEALHVDLTHPTMKAWVKAYGAIATSAKAGLTQ